MRRLARYTLNAATVLSLTWVAVVCVSPLLYSSERDGDSPLFRGDVGGTIVTLCGSLSVLRPLGPRFPGLSTGTTIPMWALILAGLALPCARWFISAMRRRSAEFAAANHLCHRCGYDLRATPTRCPECGTTAKGPA